MSEPVGLPPGTGPLAGVKVLDLSWIVAGPTVGRVLADYGATVIRVESPTRVDTARAVGPFHGDEPGVENSGLYGNVNAGKWGLTLDLRSPEARGVFRRLVQWADIVCESFTAGVLARWQPGLRASAPAEARSDHAQQHAAGADRAVQHRERIRQPGRRDGGRSVSGGLARLSAGGAVRPLHGLSRAAFRPGGTARGARPSTAHRRGRVHRSGAGGRFPTAARARPDRLSERRARTRAARQRRSAYVAARGLPLPSSW